MAFLLVKPDCLENKQVIFCDIAINTAPYYRKIVFCIRIVLIFYYVF